MSSDVWLQVPIRLDADQWVTWADCRKVLVVVHTVTAGQRLLDVVQPLETDFRIQVLYTAAPDVFCNGVGSFLRDLDGLVVPWEQATRTVFDLALAAGYGGLSELHAPLVVLPHGAGYNKLPVRRGHGGPVAARATYGLDSQRLVRDGRVLASALVLPHADHLAQLERSCPEALPAAVVAGDPCYDRIVASLPWREDYRAALGLTDAQRLVVVTSTWGRLSLLGRYRWMLRRLLRELPPERYRVAALLHPHIWFGHGPRQIRAWLADVRRLGLLLVPPEADWRGALVAADTIIGDHGSVTLYGTAVGVPILLAAFPAADVAPASAMAELAARAPRLRLNRPFLPQLERAAVTFTADAYAPVAARITSAPGQFARTMRRVVYRLLRLRPPATPPVAEPVPAPHVCC